MRKPVTRKAVGDCLTCKYCAIAIKADGTPTPPNQNYFCIKHKRILISFFYKGDIYTTGIFNASTCPNYEQNVKECKNVKQN